MENINSLNMLSLTHEMLNNFWRYHEDEMLLELLPSDLKVNLETEPFGYYIIEIITSSPKYHLMRMSFVEQDKETAQKTLMGIQRCFMIYYNSNKPKTKTFIKVFDEINELVKPIALKLKQIEDGLIKNNS